MAGDHACPVCQARFTRPQHVTRHMRSHTGDRPYKCSCGDQFARSDLLSRHVNKCHNGQGVTTTTRLGRKSNATTTTTHPAPQLAPCDYCTASGLNCDLRIPCAKCVDRNTRCVYSKTKQQSKTLSHRASFPSLTQQQQPDLLFPLQPVFSQNDMRYNNPTQPPINTLSMDRTSTLPLPLPSNALPPMAFPRSQYLHEERLPYPENTGYRFAARQQIPEGLTSSLPSSFGLTATGDLSNQPYIFGASDPSVPNTLPPLSQSTSTIDGEDPFKGTAAAHLQYRRSSLGLPYPADPPLHSQSYGSGPSDGLSFATSSSPTHTNPAPTRTFDDLKLGQRYNDIRRGSHADDGSSSEYGSSAPSPSMSYTSSRPGSSAGPAGSFGQPPSENYIAAMSGNAPPLPTPLQMQSFSNFPPAPDGASQNQLNSDGGADRDAPLFPPYQSFDNMTLEDQQAFAAAAANASARYSTGLTPFVNMNSFMSGREPTYNEVKEFWSAFISEPLTGGSTQGGQHGLSRMTSMPVMKTPMPIDRFSSTAAGLNLETPRALYPNPSQQLMLGVAKDGDPANASKIPQSNDRSTAADRNAPESPENLKRYQEACLKRETPMLRLTARPKSRSVNVMPTTQSSTSPPRREDTSDASKPRLASSFAEPLPPSKSLRDWSQAYPPRNAGGFVGSMTATNQLPPLEMTGRPTYKRLPSQTLGPEHSKKTRANGVPFPRDGVHTDEAGSGDDRSMGNRSRTSSGRESRGSNPGYPQPYELSSLPQPGYGGGPGAAQGAWMRQRSMSSPTSTRTFDWQSLDANAR